MTKPDRPLEAKGCGCGLLISIFTTMYLLTYFGVSDEVALWIAISLGVVIIVAYLVNEHKAQVVLDHEYSNAKTVPQNSSREEKSCPFCGESILSIAIKCKHCGSSLCDENTSTSDKNVSNSTKPPMPTIFEKQTEYVNNPKCPYCYSKIIITTFRKNGNTCPSCHLMLNVQQANPIILSKYDILKFRCTNCKKKIGVPNESVNKTVKCPRCGENNCVPGGNIDNLDDLFPTV